MAGITLLMLLVAYVVIWSPNFEAQVPGGDYLQFYVAARMFREGAQDRLYEFPFQAAFQHDPVRMPFSPLQEQVSLFIYPPFFVWFCLPFSYLSFKAAASAWVVFMSGCLFASVLVLTRTAVKARGFFGLALLAAVAFVPTLMSIMSCQNATLSLLIMTTAYALLRKGRPLGAGMVFALQAFKPQLTLVIVGAMLLKGQWRFILGCFIGGVALLGLSLAVSPAATAHYLALGPTMSKWIDMPGMQLADMACWQGFWRLLLRHRPLQVAQAAAAVCSLATLAFLAVGLRGPLDPMSGRFPRQFAALVLATILISPHLLYYDLTLLLLPMLILVFATAASDKNLPHDPFWLRATLVLYALATVSRSIAAATGIQLITPAILIYLVALTRSRAIQPG